MSPLSKDDFLYLEEGGSGKAEKKEIPEKSGGTYYWEAPGAEEEAWSQVTEGAGDLREVVPLYRFSKSYSKFRPEGRGSFSEVEGLVFEVLREACDSKGKAVSAQEVQELGEELAAEGFEVPETRPSRGGIGKGRWTPFTFRDRTQRWLDRLERKGLVKSYGLRGTRWYEPV